LPTPTIENIIFLSSLIVINLFLNDVKNLLLFFHLLLFNLVRQAHYKFYGSDGITHIFLIFRGVRELKVRQIDHNIILD